MRATQATQTNNDEELAIRGLVDKWLADTKSGDFDAVLRLMADDVIFMVPGREPFGKDEFAAQAKEMKDMKIDGSSDIKEIEVLGDRAWMRNHLEISITLPDGKNTKRSGYTLTILRKNPKGDWVVARDANLVM